MHSTKTVVCLHVYVYGMRICMHVCVYVYVNEHMLFVTGSYCQG